MSFRSSVCVAVVSAVHLRNPIQSVGGSMRVHKVHKHVDSETMGCVHQVFQLLRRSRSTGWREERSDMVAEAAVVRVLGHSHELHAVVAHALDPWQHGIGKLDVRRDFRLDGSHAYMRFVDLEVGRLVRPGMLEAEAILLFRLPENAVEQVGAVILPCQLRPGRDTVVPGTIVRFQADLELACMWDEGAAVRLVWQEHLPAPETLILQRCRVLPAVELTNEENLLSIGQPFAVDVATFSFVEAEDLVSLGELLHSAFFLSKLVLPPPVAVDAIPDLPLAATQGTIDFKDLQRHLRWDGQGRGLLLATCTTC
mmetsp:Transcript_96666/g.134130  ORF Transcript_96666/g.134130 Transcript_96666/m.134130 type:complete len:311 (+) Transcript_96666:1762-2694(+)